MTSRYGRHGSRAVRGNPDERMRGYEGVLERLIQAGPNIRRWAATALDSMHSTTMATAALRVPAGRSPFPEGALGLAVERGAHMLWRRDSLKLTFVLSRERPLLGVEVERFEAALPEVYKYFEWADSVMFEDEWIPFLLKVKALLDSGQPDDNFCENCGRYGERESTGVTCRVAALSPYVTEDWQVVIQAWCDRCYRTYTRACEGCGAVLDDRDFPPRSLPHCRRTVERPDEDDEAEDTSVVVVSDYHAAQDRIRFRLCKSMWTRAQPKPLYFGVELEVFIPPNEPGTTRTSTDREPYARQVLDSIGPKFGDFLYDIQHDGSLGRYGRDGFEIITQPCGLDTHREHWSRANFTNLLNEHYEDPGRYTAGMHIHFSKSALETEGSGRGGRHYPVLGRMAQFICAPRNKKFVETVARRAFCEYAQNTLTDGIADGRSSASFHRHALNMTGDHTAEFRLPKSTSDVTTIMATLEFTFLLLRFCEETTDTDKLDAGHFKKFVARDVWQNDSQFLRPYLVDKRLATPRAMKLRPIPGTEGGDEPVRSNPSSRRSRLNDDTPGPYLRRALARYRRLGEQP